MTSTMSRVVDWKLVRELQDDCTRQLTIRETAGGRDLDEPARRALAESVVVGHIGQHARQLVREGKGAITPEQERVLVDAVLAAMFGLGRLEPLLNDPDIEDIEISGYDNVTVTDSRGTVRRVDPVADSDAELRKLIVQLAATAGHRERLLTDATPLMHMRLPNGSRMTANIVVTKRPEVTIRNHRLVDVSLEDMLIHRTLSEDLRSFLAAAVHARKNIIVTGNLGAGKTTLVRALLKEIDPGERFATIETAFELQADTFQERCVAYEAQPGTGEPEARTGRRSGEITLYELIEHALLQHHRRIILGEVRGQEIGPMLEVMQLGEGGSMSTLHSRSAHHALTRMATLVTSRTRLNDDSAARAWIADAVDLIVHVRRVDSPGRRQRFVSDVLSIGTYADGRITVDEVFKPVRPGSGAFRTQAMPEIVQELSAFGYVPQHGGGL